MGNIIIFGGGLNNKGAQAMTMTALCELKKRFPTHRLLLLTWDTGAQARKQYAMYDLELLTVPPLKFARAARNPLKKAAYTLRYGKAFTEVDTIYRNTDLLIDISGYALGSNWGAKICNDYLDNIEYALRYDIPVYLLPQSFGPFDFQDAAGKRVDGRIRALLPRVRLICAREKEGYRALLRRYGLDHNTVLCRDLVLARGITDFSPALRGELQWSLPEIDENSMCLIPNIRAAEPGSTAERLWRAAIEAGLSRGLTVYIASHCTQDRALCAGLKAAFSEDSRVVLLEQEFGCIEFNELVKKFRFLVVSRFHAIVHGLKNGVPCVALGWAEKYAELLELFGQEQYLIDLRRNVEPKEVHKAVISMARSCGAEAQKIRTLLPTVQGENVFDRIKKL